MRIRIHLKDLLAHCGMPHMVVGVKVRAVDAGQHLRDSLRRDALRARALDHKMTQLYYQPEIESDAWVLVVKHRRYMNG